MGTSSTSICLLPLCGQYHFVYSHFIYSNCIYCTISFSLILSTVSCFLPFCLLNILCTPILSTPISNVTVYIWAASWENRIFANAKTKTQISFAITVKLISAFVFATQIVQSLYFLNPKFQASSYLLWLYSPVCVGPGRKLRRPVFSERGS